MVESISNRRTTFVSFSGVDGAGKSSQIQTLSAYFRQQGLRVEVIAFWDRVACLTRLREEAGRRIFKGESGVGSPEVPVNRRDKNIRSWPISCARLCFYFFDALAARRTVRNALRSGTDFVIFDRYTYDELANLNVRSPVIRAYARAIMKMVPRPDVSYLLDADPSQARARKPEYPLEFMYINRQSYLDLGSLLGGITVIPPMSIQDVQREVLFHALKALSIGPTPGGSNGVPLQKAS